MLGTNIARRGSTAEVSDDLPGLIRNPRNTGRRLRGSIIHKLGTAILSGQYAPGEILPNELALSDSLDVSRSALREALRILAGKGLVASRPKAGTQVSPRERWNLLDPEVLTWAFDSGPDMSLVRALFELRAIVEPAAAGLAATRRAPADLKAMKTALAAMRQMTPGPDAGSTAERDFHGAVLRATRNEALIVLEAGIGAVVNWTTRHGQAARALPRNPLPDLTRVFDAIVARDAPAAAEAMHSLVQTAQEDARRALEV
ncbi:FadR/GntR family transcriptional regulator [Sphingomonas aerophila]|uniref:DNA-binding FadR family transcriptional regulator n=1 Tax=Sphingomonas aerophila TaxID=1344948 RepID=A0A7W9BDD1_9SPHN|nr:FadR/GntR family transcriptional regulator [Sphingomonas aerophila]MBB5715082.1 DNA-binding FadR family transcriptional regulator [Sphingomonas aerophila]